MSLPCFEWDQDPVGEESFALIVVFLVPAKDMVFAKDCGDLETFRDEREPSDREEPESVLLEHVLGFIGVQRVVPPSEAQLLELGFGFSLEGLEVDIWHPARVLLWPLGCPLPPMHRHSPKGCTLNRQKALEPPLAQSPLPPLSFRTTRRTSWRPDR